MGSHYHCTDTVSMFSLPTCIHSAVPTVLVDFLIAKTQRLTRSHLREKGLQLMVWQYSASSWGRYGSRSVREQRKTNAGTLLAFSWLLLLMMMMSIQDSNPCTGATHTHSGSSLFIFILPGLHRHDQRSISKAILSLLKFSKYQTYLPAGVHLTTTM